MNFSSRLSLALEELLIYDAKDLSGVARRLQINSDLAKIGRRLQFSLGLADVNSRVKDIPTLDGTEVPVTDLDSGLWKLIEHTILAMKRGDPDIQQFARKEVDKLVQNRDSSGPAMQRANVHRLGFTSLSVGENDDQFSLKSECVFLRSSVIY